MGFLITDSKAGVYLADQQGKIIQHISNGFSFPCWPCASPEHLVAACRLQRECLCIHRGRQQERQSLPALPGLGGMCLSPCGRYLYQLSTEADCIHTFHLGSGELCYAIPAGVFPRSMQLNRDGRYLLAAGGAVGEAYLLSSRRKIVQDNRAHLTTGVPRAAKSPATRLSGREMEEMRELFGNISDSEIYSLYKRVTK